MGHANGVVSDSGSSHAGSFAMSSRWRCADTLSPATTAFVVAVSDPSLPVDNFTANNRGVAMFSATSAEDPSFDEPVVDGWPFGWSKFDVEELSEEIDTDVGDDNGSENGADVDEPESVHAPSIIATERRPAAMCLGR